MANQDTYGIAQGIREDLSDFIYNISPTDTPVLQAAEWTTATSTNHEWTEDVLEPPVANNAKAEGASMATPDAVSGGTRLGNYTQISRKTYGVSGTAEVVTKVGRDSEIAFGRAKSMRELKTDIDMAICAGNNPKSAGTAGAGGNPRRSASLDCWIRNASRGSGGADPATFDGAASDGLSPLATSRAFSQAFLDTTIEKCWNEGGRPSLLVLGGEGRKKFATFDGVGAGTNTMRTDRSEKTVYGTVDVYISSYGIDLRAVNSRHLRKQPAGTGGLVDRDAWLIDPEHIKVAYLRPYEIEEFAKTGDSIEEAVQAEWTLQVDNTRAHGLVADLKGV